MAGPWEAFKPASPAVIDPRAVLDSEPAAPPVESGRLVITPRGTSPDAVQAGQGGPWETFRAPKVEEPAKPRKPDAGVNDALQRGLMQGITANWNDELQAIAKAGGATDDFNGIQHLILGLSRLATGDEEARKVYDEEVAKGREANKAAQENHPVVYTGADIGGGLLTLPAGGEIAGPVRLTTQMLRGARTGAIYGGAAGAGSGEGLADKVTQGAAGTVTGGAVGAAAPALVEGVVRGARAVAEPIINTIRGIRQPGDEAARRIAIAAERDIRADPQAVSRLTPEEFVASGQNGGPARILDVGGETTRALARSAANTSPEGRAILNREIDERFEGQAGRVNDWLRNTFHFPDAAAQQEAIEATARSVNRPNYQRAMQEGAHGVWSPELRRLAGAPAIREAANGAVPSLANRGISEGFTAPRRNPLQWNAESGRASLRRLQSGNEIIPDLRFWDQVKRGLDSQITMAQRKGNSARVNELTGLRSSLVRELDNLVPSYQQARRGAAHFFGAEDALEAGQNFVARNMPANEARRALSQMSPLERQLFQDGFVSRFMHQINDVADRRSVLNKIAESPNAREKLEVALGPQRARELEAGLRVEGVMDLARNAVQGNSTTARQLAELGLAGGAYGLSSGGNLNPFSDPGAVANAALVYGAARGRNAINERLSRQVAEMLTSNDPHILLRGIQTIARSRELFDGLRRFDLAFARGAGRFTPAQQISGAVSRADDKQDAPRPPNN